MPDGGTGHLAGGAPECLCSCLSIRFLFSARQDQFFSSCIVLDQTPLNMERKTREEENIPNLLNHQPAFYFFFFLEELSSHSVIGI